jgi:urease accessory protein
VTCDLPRATAVARDGEPFDHVTLDYEARHRRRVRLVTARGLELLLDLPEARHLRDGDRLVLEDGRLVMVRAAPERVIEIAAADPRELARLAWHLGNRHTPTQVLPGLLRIREDHVLAEMLRALGAHVLHTEAPFDPETGAYSGSHGH